MAIIGLRVLVAIWVQTVAIIILIVFGQMVSFVIVRYPRAIPNSMP